MPILVAVIAAGCIDPTQVDAASVRIDAARHHPSAYLWAHPYPDLVVELHHAPGFVPSELAMASR